MGHISTQRASQVTSSGGGLCPDPDRSDRQRRKHAQEDRTGLGAPTATHPGPPPTPGSGRSAGCWLSPSPGGADSSLGHRPQTRKHHCHIWGPPTIPASRPVIPDNTSLGVRPTARTLPLAFSGLPLPRPLPQGSEPAEAKL